MSRDRVFTVLFTAALFLLTASIRLPALSLYGDAETQFDFYIPGESGDDRYDSLINPENIMGLNDMGYSMDMTFKLENFSDESSFIFWGSLEKDSGQSESSSYNLNVMRLRYDWAVSDAFRLRIGRQGFLTGYGYGWNPMDLINPLKNPSDPEQEMKGVDALSLVIDRGGMIQTEGCLVVDTAGSERIEYGDIRGSAIMTLLLPLAEMKLSVLIGNNYALGAGFLADIAGAGVYGEASLREKSRVSLPGEGPDYLLSEEDGSIFSFLAGCEYVFPSELTVTAEYFYNGEGLDKKDRENYSNALAFFNAETETEAEYYKIYRPGYFAEHYLLLNLFYPLYFLNSELSCSIIESPDSASLAIRPEWRIIPTGNLEMALGWSGLFSLDDSLNGEARLAPVNQSAYLKAVYHF
ncbi:MAG: hypothetical protein B6241_07820 [Spirochaetaceae bacterium 4572_59]|nr:MAG: hypothetical protein B6241_07820 [Spirochaetaceae bacterium 4572_59]